MCWWVQPARAAVVEGADAKMKPGIVGYKAGDSGQFCLDVERLPLGTPFVFILGHLISYEHMGAARVTCHDACACEAMDVDAHVPGGKFSVFKAKTFAARRVAWAGANASSASSRIGAPILDPYTHPSVCGCKIGLTILPRSDQRPFSGEYKFKVLSLMTALREGSLRYGHQAGFNNRPMEPRFS